MAVRRGGVSAHRDADDPVADPVLLAPWQSTVRGTVPAGVAVKPSSRVTAHLDRSPLGNPLNSTE